MNETELVKRAQKGDSAAFEQLVLDNQKAVYNFCLRMTKNREDAYDLSQEAFIKAFRGLSSFKGDSSFSTWLYRLTSNVCIDFLRKVKKNNVVSLTFEDGDGQEKIIEVPDTAPTPDETAQSSELRREIEKAMTELSEEHRQVLVMREINQLSYQEIAEVLEINVGTVKSRISRARRELCSRLEHWRNFSAGTSSNIDERE